VPHYLGSTVHSVSQDHDLSPFSYQGYSSSDFLCPICTVSYPVHSMHRWSLAMKIEGGKRKTAEQRDKDPPCHGRGRSTAVGSSGAAPRGRGDKERRDQYIEDEERLEMTGRTTHARHPSSLD
jgi:hypothetical protein